MTLAHQIKFTASMIVSDDTGQLMRLIQALAILCGLLIAITQIILPLLEWLQQFAVMWQQVIMIFRTWPIGQMVTG